MLLRRLLPLLGLFCLTSTSLGAEIKRERREATLGALVGGLASPFINFKRGVLNLLGGSKAQKKPAKQAPKPSYGAPAPSYQAPAPSYSPPVPSYDPPAPSYSAPAPAYDAPAAPAYEPPAPKPDIQILPAPDLSQYAPAAAPAVDTYGSPEAAPVVDTYGSPAAAPAVDTYGSPAAAPAVDTYGSPEAAPAVSSYNAPVAAPAVDSYGSPVLPNYVVEQDEPEVPAQPPVYEPEAPAQPPVYEPEAPAQPPVYEPATYEPAPVDIPLKSVEPAPVEPAPAEAAPVEAAPVEAAPNAEYTVDLTKEAEPPVVDVVDVKSVVDVRTSDAPEAREPKAFSADQPTSNELQTVDEKPIVIDLTNNFADIAITTETVQTTVDTKKIIETEEAETEKPVATKIITFEAVENIPAISGPVQSSDEVISFTPRQETAVRNIDFTAVQNEAQSDTFTAAPEAVTEAVAETVTPIVANEELRSVVVELDSVPVEIAEIEEVDTSEVEVIDLRTNKKSSGLTIVDHDEDHPEVIVVVDETTTTAVPIKTQDEEALDTQEVVSVDAAEEEIIKESDTDFSLVNAVVTTAVPAEIVSAKDPELRRVTFQILSDEEAENVNPEVTFKIVDPAEANKNTFDTFEIVETTTNSDTEQVDLINTNIGEVPAAIGSDPVFQEIVKTSEDTENVKRGYNAYDPRHSQVYAHKYNDKYSNWYYFRKGY